MMITIGTLLTLIGVGLIWLAWRLGRDGRTRARLVARCGGWGLLALSLWPWQVAAGTDRGVALAITVMMLAALLIVGVIGWRHYRANGGNSRRRRRTTREIETVPQSRGELLSRIWIFFLAGPIAGMTTVALVLVVNSAGADWAPANRLALDLLVVPVAWPLLALLATYDMPLRRRSAMLLVTLTISVSLAVLLPGGPV